jgi:hypothetical protein
MARAHHAVVVGLVCPATFAPPSPFTLGKINYFGFKRNMPESADNNNYLWDDVNTIKYNAYVYRLKYAEIKSNTCP